MFLIVNNDSLVWNFGERSALVFKQAILKKNKKNRNDYTHKITLLVTTVKVLNNCDSSVFRKQKAFWIRSEYSSRTVNWLYFHGNLV